MGVLNVHDNDYLDDMHTLPGLSKMNREEITKTLAEVNCQGDFTLETNRFFDSFETEEKIGLGLKFSEVIGRKMIGEIKKYRLKSEKKFFYHNFLKNIKPPLICAGFFINEVALYV